MFTIIRAFLITLGSIFLLLLVAVAYIWFSNTWQVQTLAQLWFGATNPPDVTDNTSGSPDVRDDMSENEAAADGATETTTAQDEAMAEAGVDASFFTSLSAAEVQCFRDRLGNDRVDAIIAGGLPTTAEIIAGLPCIE